MTYCHIKIVKEILDKLEANLTRSLTAARIVFEEGFLGKNVNMVLMWESH